MSPRGTEGRGVEEDELRTWLSSPLLQLLAWTTVALFVSAAAFSVCFRVTKDPVPGWLGIVALALGAVMVRITVKTAERPLHGHQTPKESND